MKSKVNKGVIIAVSCLAVLLIGILAFGVYIYNSDEAHELCMDMCAYGWEEYITYPMLSAELKEIVSEEEFSDRSPEGRLNMYKKLNGLVLDTRPNDKFDGRTSWFKSPYCDIIEVDGGSYRVEFGIDLIYTFGRIEVRNFTAGIVFYEEEKITA